MNILLRHIYWCKIHREREIDIEKFREGEKQLERETEKGMLGREREKRLLDKERKRKRERKR